SYLGSSFAFIGPVLTATGAAVAAGANPNIGVALGGIIAAGAFYTMISLIVLAAGHRWVERLMPPVVTGGIVAAIGLVLAPIAIVLVAENLGHIKAIGAMTGRNLDQYLGRAFIGDGIATMVSASGGGTGVTTYAENMGVMAITRIYSTALFIAAAIIAILLGFSPKFGALILTIPGPVLGGLSIVVFGLIAATAGRIWVENRVDFSAARNLITVAVALVLGAGNFKLSVAGFTLDGIGTATFGCIILYHLLNAGRRE